MTEIRWRIYILLILTLFTGNILASAAPAPEPGKIKPAMLATGDNYPPFSDKKLPGGGLAADLIVTALAAREIKVDLTWTSWKRVESLTGEHRYAAAFPYIRTLERAKRFQFSTPLYKVNTYFFSSAKISEKALTPEWLKGKRFCRPLGYGMEPNLQRILDQGLLIVSTPQSQETCFKQLKSGRVDLLVESNPVAELIIKELSGSAGEVFRFDSPIDSIEHFLITSKENSKGVALIESFNQGLDKIKKSGVYDEILKKHSFK